MALHGAEPRRTSHGSHQRKKPSKQEIGGALRKGLGILGKLAKSEDVIKETVAPKKKKKMAPKPPKPVINPGLRSFRKSVSDRALKPSVAGLLRAQ